MKLQEIIDQLNNVYDGSPWYGNTLSTFLKNLSQKNLDHSAGEVHSIGQILEHMLAWRHFVIDKLHGKEKNLQVNSPEDWKPKHHPELKKLIEEFQGTQEQLLHILSSQSDDLLTKQVPGKEISFEELLVGIIQHDIYHLGQVYLLTKSSRT